MKLAELKNRVKEIEDRTVVLRERLRKGPLNSISAAMDELNKIAGERQQLKLLVSQAEIDTIIVGNNLHDLVIMLDTMESRISALSELKQRDDLPPEVSSTIFDQIDSFSKMRNQLKNSMEKTYWQVDVEIPTNLGTGPQK